MAYENLRYVEQLLSNIYKEGLTDEHEKKIKLYFEKNYGEDALVKPKSAQDIEKERLVQQIERSLVPDNLQNVLTKAVKRTFEED